MIREIVYMMMLNLELPKVPVSGLSESDPTGKAGTNNYSQVVVLSAAKPTKLKWFCETVLQSASTDCVSALQSNIVVPALKS